MQREPAADRLLTDRLEVIRCSPIVGEDRSWHTLRRVFAAERIYLPEDVEQTCAH